jgi:ribosome-binding ATPase
MRVAIIGLPGSGKSTVFQALGGRPASGGAEEAMACVPVPDDRVDRLAAIYHPRKTTRATVDFVDLAHSAGLRGGAGELGQSFLNSVRQASALVHVIDAFSLPGDVAEVSGAIEALDAELALSDLDQCEKRLERIKKEGRQAGAVQHESRLLTQASDFLGRGTPLRRVPELVAAEELRGFAFLTAKPMITLLNTAEDAGHTELSLDSRSGPQDRVVSLAGALEAEIAELSPEEARDFLSDYGISEPARELVIRSCYQLLGLISFFTVGEDEVKAWTIPQGASARQGAAIIHSDIARGFIRAEVIDCGTVLASGSFEEAKQHGKLRLEGRDYVMKDGDVVSFRFNV